MLSRLSAQQRKEEASGSKELKQMPLMCLSSSITEVHLGFSAGLLCSCSLQGPLYLPAGSDNLGTLSALTWMAPGGAAEEAQTGNNHVSSWLTRREWSCHCQTWLCPCLPSSLLLQEGWQRTRTVTQSTSVSRPGRNHDNKGITHAMKLPPACSPRGLNSVTRVGHMTEQSIAGKNGKTALRWEICCSCCMELGWEGAKGVRERLGDKSKCQLYLELANCWGHYRGICRVVVTGWKPRTTSGSVVILSVSREAEVMPPGWGFIENSPDICKWIRSFKNTFLPSNVPHIHHPGHITDIVFALVAKLSVYCCPMLYLLCCI